MPRRMSEMLRQRKSENFIGRGEELTILLDALEGIGPPVFHLHGIAGVGKSALLGELRVRARERGATVVPLDCRSIEPTEHGFLTAVSAAIGGGELTLQDTAARLCGLGPRVLLTLDTYELFRLLDTWLRQRFIPAVTDNVRLVCAGREPPGPAWLIAPEWQGLFRSLAPRSSPMSTCLTSPTRPPARLWKPALSSGA